MSSFQQKIGAVLALSSRFGGPVLGADVLADIGTSRHT